MARSLVRRAVQRTGSQLYDARVTVPMQRRVAGYTLVDVGFTQTVARLCSDLGVTLMQEWFAVHEGLTATARVPSLARAGGRVSTLEVLVLLASGAAAAAAVGMGKLGLGIPGHTIVLAVLPLALGLSLAPRRLGGSVMSTGALGTAWMLQSTGTASFGSGAFVSLCLLGPLMDLALRNARSARRVYTALIVAGAVTNLTALASRAGTKVLGLDIGGRPFDGWWLQAIGTYTASGIVAGLLGALCWFHFNQPRRQSRRPAATP